MPQRYTRDEFKNFKRVLIKIGTGVVTNSKKGDIIDGTISLSRISHLVEQISTLKKLNKEVIIVSSGAVGLGRHKLSQQAVLNGTMRSHIDGFKKEEWDKRACAAAGQNSLVALYDYLFSLYDIAVSQILVTDDDFLSKEVRGNLNSTVEQLIKLGIIPIFNENDVVTRRKVPYADVEGKIFWDNDSLACLVGQEMNADLIILLSDIKGLFTLPPGDKGSELIHEWNDSSTFVIGEKSSVGTGGIKTKVEAALSAVQNGVKAVLIASGFDRNTILDVVHGKRIGTLFTGRPKKVAPLPRELVRRSKEASRALQRMKFQDRAALLLSFAAKLLEKKDLILKENADDLKNAQRSSLTKALVNRMSLTEEKLRTLHDGIVQIATAHDPLGVVLESKLLSDGLVLDKVTCPIGVLMVIVESRPDVFPQIFSLSWITGNGLLIKGGSEVLSTNLFFMKLISECLEELSAPAELQHAAILLQSRHEVEDLLSREDIDLIIPRGSNNLVEEIKSKAKTLVLGHAAGICHIYVDKFAKWEKAVRIVIDAKKDYPAACNAVETVLIHSSFPPQLVRDFIDNLKSNNIKVLGGPVAHRMFLLDPCTGFSHEYGDEALTIEIVDTLDDAILHINTYGSGHTDSIITEDQASAFHFQHEVDSACCFHNCSTRFTDGFKFGLGAEVGISTNKVHSRGPVGVEGLLTYKWLLGSSAPNGHAASDFHQGRLKFLHTTLPVQSKL